MSIKRSLPLLAVLVLIVLAVYALFNQQNNKVPSAQRTVEGAVVSPPTSFMSDCKEAGKEESFCRCIYDKGYRGNYYGYPDTIVNEGQRALYNNTGAVPTSTPLESC